MSQEMKMTMLVPREEPAGETNRNTGSTTNARSV